MSYVLGKEQAGRSGKREEWLPTTVAHGWRVLHSTVVNLGKNLCGLHIVDGCGCRLPVVVQSFGGGINDAEATEVTVSALTYLFFLQRMCLCISLKLNASLG